MFRAPFQEQGGIQFLHREGNARRVEVVVDETPRGVEPEVDPHISIPVRLDSNNRRNDPLRGIAAARHVKGVSGDQVVVKGPPRPPPGSLFQGHVTSLFGQDPNAKHAPIRVHSDPFPGRHFHGAVGADSLRFIQENLQLKIQKWNDEDNQMYKKNAEKYQNAPLKPFSSCKQACRHQGRQDRACGQGGQEDARAEGSRKKPASGVPKCVVEKGREDEQGPATEDLEAGFERLHGKVRVGVHSCFLARNRSHLERMDMRAMETGPIFPRAWPNSM